MTESHVTLVTTQTAVYEVDIERRKVRRHPQDRPLDEVYEVATNRRDGEWMTLVQMIRMEVGERMQFFVRIPETPPGALTFRNTTPVRHITTVSMEDEPNDNQGPK